jgi:hypothetical protein
LGDTVDDGKAGGAAGPVTAHFRFGTIGIIKTPPKIGSRGILDEDEALGSHPQLRRTQALGEAALLRLRDEKVSVVNQDKIITPAVHLEKKGTAVV